MVSRRSRSATWALADAATAPMAAYRSWRREVMTMAVDYHGELGSASVRSTQELELLGPLREMSWIAICRVPKRWQYAPRPGSIDGRDRPQPWQLAIECVHSSRARRQDAREPPWFSLQARAVTHVRGRAVESLGRARESRRAQLSRIQEWSRHRSKLPQLRFVAQVVSEFRRKYAPTNFRARRGSSCSKTCSLAAVIASVWHRSSAMIEILSVCSGKAPCGCAM